jgi:hypothetical protein
MMLVEVLNTNIGVSLGPCQTRVTHSHASSMLKLILRFSCSFVKLSKSMNVDSQNGFEDPKYTSWLSRLTLTSIIGRTQLTIEAVVPNLRIVSCEFITKLLKLFNTCHY